MTDPKCKWEQDEVCVNADCPMCADFCPVVFTPGVCRFEEREEPCEACSLDWLYNDRETAGRLPALQNEGRGTDSSLRSE